jgi:uncharacterized membrane protein YhaH (DUF805 family)
MTVVVMFVQVRRAHDFGRSGWWGVAATVTPLLIVVPMFYVAGETVAAVVGIAVELILLVLLGALPGDVGENRFGPPPPFTARQILVGR